MENVLKIIYLMLLIILISSCAKATNPNKSSSPTEPLIEGPNPPNPPHNPPHNPPILPIAMGKYKVNISATNGIKNLCEGYAIIHMIDAANQKVQGQIQCLVSSGNLFSKGQVVTLDLSKMMPAPSNGIYDAESMKQYPHFGKIARRPNPQEGQDGVFFYPPRPMQLGPIIQDPSVFENFAHSEQSVVKIVSNGQQLTDSGVFSLRVISTNENFIPPLYSGNLQFENILHWELNAAGFNKIPQKSKNIAVHAKTEYWINPRPLTILKIKYQTKLSDLQEGNFAKTADLFIGNLIIELDVIEYNELK